MSYTANKLKQLPLADKVIRPIYRAVVYPSRRKRALELLNGIRVRMEKRIWYCGIPRHANLGDIAQKLCICDWAKTFFPEHEIISIPAICFEYAGKETIAFIDSYLSDDDFFLFQSGYTMSDKHGDESFHRMIPESFSKHAILVMPQTINYKSEEKMKRTAAAFAANDRTVLLARDSVSYQIAREYFHDTFSDLYPDIVTTLIGTYQYDDSYSREGVLFCLRNDSEKLYSPSELMRLIRYYEARTSVSVTDTTKAELDPSASDEELMAAVSKQINEFAKYKVTVTDRFHGMILSLVAGTPVVVLATNDHKVTTGADWFLGNSSFEIAKAESPEAAVSLIDRYLVSMSSSHPDRVFRQKFYCDLPVLLKERGFPIGDPQAVCLQESGNSEVLDETVVQESD